MHVFGFAYVHGKHRQTRNYFATYNALLEIKELTLKETSLLNSVISHVSTGELDTYAVNFSLAFCLIFLFSF